MKCFTKCINVLLISILCVGSSGCSSDSGSLKESSNIDEVNGVKIVKTTDAGDDVVTDNNGNQFTLKQEEESIHVYCPNYKTETTELLPVMEIDGSYATDLELNEHEFMLDIKDSGTGNTQWNFWMSYTYDSKDDVLTWTNVREDLGTDISDNSDEEVKNYLESDNMKSLCNELIVTVKAYQQLKDN